MFDSLHHETAWTSNDLLAPERKGRAGKSGGILSSAVATALSAW